MENYNITFKHLNNNNAKLRRDDVKRVLVIYEEKIFYLGDACILFDKIKYIKTLFKNSIVDLNFINDKRLPLYNAFLKNNPHLNSMNALKWDEIDFINYELIICVTFKEKELLHYIHTRYSLAGEENLINFGIVSLSKDVMWTGFQGDFIFQRINELPDYNDIEVLPYELYLSIEERNWADQWLVNKGIQNDEKLFILLDSSSEREKILNLPEYFKLLEWILNIPNIKVLIFDEKDIGKEEFYKEWLGAKKTQKLIFSKGLSLRQDLCLIGSRYTRFVFGPCTGLMHCASGIFNNIFKTNLSQTLYKQSNAPILITYTGKYKGEGNGAKAWWGNSPMVNCLMLRNLNGNKRIFLLHKLSVDNMNNSHELPCNEYEAKDLLNIFENEFEIRKYSKVGEKTIVI
jgi:hypothetical protein